MFEPFHDQENAGQVVGIARPLVSGPSAAPVGKTFQPAGVKTGPTAQRKALGDVNRQLTQTTAGPDKAQPPPALKPVVPAKKLTVSVSEAKPETVKEERNEADLPPIEFMPTWDKKDTYEDIWAPHLAPATYVEELREWRPRYLLPSEATDSDSDDDLQYADISIDRDSSIGDLAREEFLEELSPEALGLSLPSPDEIYADLPTNWTDL